MSTECSTVATAEGKSQKATALFDLVLDMFTRNCHSGFVKSQSWTWPDTAASSNARQSTG